MRLERKVAVRRLLLALAAVVIGGAIGAVQYLPVSEYVAWSPRAGGLSDYSRATSYSMPPEELINTYLPQFSGLLAAYWGRNGIHFHSEYVGVVVLMLATAGVTGSREDASRRRFVIFFVVTGVLALLWALGGYTPFYRLIYAVVPGTKFFRAPSTIFFVVSFMVAALAAFGAERALAGRIGGRFVIGWLVAAALLTLIAVTGGLENFALSMVGEERFDLITANQPAIVVGAVRSLVFVLITGAVLTARQRGRLRADQTGWALAVLVALDLWTILRHYWLFSAPAAQLYAADPIVEYLRREPQPGRLLALELGPPQAPHDPYFNGDAFMIHRVRDARGYHSNELGRYDILGGKAEGWRTMFGSPRFWQLMNVRYFVTDVPDLPIEGATRLVGPVRNSAGTMSYLFSLPGEHPAAWVAPVIVKASDEVVLATLSDPRFDDIRRAALFDTSARVTARENSRTLPPVLPIGVSVSRYDPGHITVRLDAPAPSGSALLVSENYYPGWRATSAGKELPLGRANFTLIGVELTAGATDVDLTFHSAPYERGKLVTWLAIGLALLMTLGGVFAARRSRV